MKSAPQLPQDADDECAHRPGRPRCEKAMRAIERSTLTLLRRTGFAALSIEAIAEKAGVGKATVYRWWPNKAALVVDAFFAAVSPRIPFPDTGTIRGDFTTQMSRVVEEMNGPNGRLLTQIIMATQADPAMREAFRTRWMRPRRAEGEQAIRRAIERGELPRTTDTEFLFDSLYGPLYLRLLFEHQVLDRKFVDRLVDTVFAGLTAPSASRKRSR